VEIQNNSRNICCSAFNPDSTDYCNNQLSQLYDSLVEAELFH